MLDHFTCMKDINPMRVCVCLFAWEEKEKGVCVFECAVSKSSQLTCPLNIQAGITLILHHWKNEIQSNSLRNIKHIHL